MRKCISTGKSMFFKEEVAKKVALKFAKTSVFNRVNTYKCSFCHSWHLTHQKKRK